MIFTFGKHKGCKFTEVMDYDAEYFLWLDEQSTNLSADLQFFIEDNRDLLELKAISQDHGCPEGYNDLGWGDYWH